MNQALPPPPPPRSWGAAALRGRATLESLDVCVCVRVRWLLCGSSSPQRRATMLRIVPRGTSSKQVRAGTPKKKKQRKNQHVQFPFSRCFLPCSLASENAKESLALMPLSKPRERLMLRALNRYGTGPDGCAQAWLSLPHSMRVFYLHAYCSRSAANSCTRTHNTTLSVYLYLYLYIHGSLRN